MSFEQQQHRYPLMIRESHLDTFGHVNHATYLQLFEEARWQWLFERGFGFHSVKEHQVGQVILNLKIEYKRELHNRDEVVILSRASELRHPLKFQMEQRLELASSGEYCAGLVVEAGLMNLRTRKLIHPPQEWKQALGF